MHFLYIKIFEVVIALKDRVYNEDLVLGCTMCGAFLVELVCILTTVILGFLFLIGGIYCYLCLGLLCSIIMK